MPWTDEIDRGLDEACANAGFSDWPGGQCRFWHLSYMPDESVLSNAIADICQAAARNQNVKARPAIAVLLYLLRDKLSGVRGNRLWPDVTDRFNALSNCKVWRDDLGHYFRRLMWTLYPDRLIAFDRHNRYVMLLLDEAGIGHDRAKIIVQFLTKLAESDSPGTTDTGWSATLDAEFSRFARNHYSRSDVFALEEVLRNSGVAVLRLKAAILAMPNPFEARIWGWDQINAFAEQSLGLPLTHVIPEARQVFPALIPHFGRVITCDQLITLLRDNRYDLRLPQELYSIRTARSADHIPLCNVTIRAGNVSNEFSVSDRLGITADLLAKSRQNQWLRRGENTWFIWREAPFRVLVDGRPSGHVRKFYDQYGELLGFVWSGYLRPSQSCEVETPRLPLVRDAVFRPIYSWHFSKDSVSLNLRGFVHYGIDTENKVTLSLSGAQIWSGHLQTGGHFVQTPEVSRLQFSPDEALTGVEVELAYDSSEHMVASLRLPRPPIAVLEGDLLRPGNHPELEGRPRGLAGAIFIGPASLGKPSPNTGTIAALLSYPTPANFNAWTIVDDEAADAPMRVQWSGLDWKIDPCTPQLSTAPIRCITFEHFEAISTGNINLVRREDFDEVQINMSGLYSGPSWGIKVRAGVFSFVVRLPDSTKAIVIREVLKSAPAAIRDSLFGLAFVALTRDQCTEGAELCFFITGRDAEIPPNRLDEVPHLVLHGDSDTTIRIISRSLAQSHASLATSTLIFPEEAGLEPTAGVSFIWTPRIYDCQLLGEDGQVITESLTIKELNSVRPQLISGDGQWVLRLSRPPITERVHDVALDSSINFEQEVLKFLSVPPTIAPSDTPISISAIHANKCVRSWSIDCSAQDISVTLDESSVIEFPDIRLNADWIGLPEADCRLSVRLPEGRILQSSRLTPLSTTTKFKNHSSVRLAIPGLAFCAGLEPRSVEVTFEEGGTPRWTGTLSIQQEGFQLLREPIRIRRRIQEILTTKHEDSLLNYYAVEVLALTESYLKQTEQLPFDPERLMASFKAAFQNAEQAGFLAVCMATRIQLLRESTVPTVRPPVSYGLQLECLLGNTLLLFVLAREHAAGTMNRSQAEEL